MRVAVLSDIHGNVQALTSVVKDLEANKCERVFCLGDLAMAGPQPDVVIDYVRNRPDWVVIQGNTDKLIADYSIDILENVRCDAPVMASALANDIKIINKDEKNYLKNLPVSRELDVCGVKVLLVHGSPRRNNEDILPGMPVEVVEEMLEGVDAHLIFCGHTHIPAGYQTTKKQTVVNTGSVGRPMNGNTKACYVIADFDNETFSIEHRFVEYDKITAAKIMVSRNFPGCEKIASMILHQSERHI